MCLEKQIKFCKIIGRRHNVSSMESIVLSLLVLASCGAKDPRNLKSGLQNFLYIEIKSYIYKVTMYIIFKIQL